MAVRDLLQKIWNRVEENGLLLCLRQSMVLVVPVIMAGSFALVLSSLPVPGYQEWLAAFLGGAVRVLLVTIYDATLGSISLLLLLTISFYYTRTYGSKQHTMTPVVTLCAYLAYVGDDFSFSVFTSGWLFTAILLSLASSALFIRLCTGRRQRAVALANAANDEFKEMASAIPAAVFVVFLFALLHVAFHSAFGDTNVQNLVSNLLLRGFEKMGRTFGSSLLFIFLVDILWFFGLHGGNVMDGVAQSLFADGTAVNQAQLAAGQIPTEIYSKTFLDTFVQIGGSGSLLCLVIAILIFSRKRNSRALAKFAVFPVLFNVNELVLFGLPIVFNPILLIPFVGAPFLLTCISAAATSLGLVPHAVNSVMWTTPVFLSGYAATGSLAGSILQGVNLIAGIAIYFPFVRLAQRRSFRTVQKNVALLTQYVKDSESLDTLPDLLRLNGQAGLTARSLAGELRHALKKGEISLYFQPQVRADGTLAGGEALLRFRHETAGMLYPPLVIALAREDGWINDLGLYVLEETCASAARIQKETGLVLKFSANISAIQLRSPHFVEHVREILHRHSIDPAQFGLELTEQEALESSLLMKKQLEALRALGLKLIMDDFGVGHTSLLQLQEHVFDIVKLDGSLVRGLSDNSRSGEIISAIVSLSRSLHFDIIAEYVETREQRDRLKALGCGIYQGYLFSPAVTEEEFLAYARQL